MNSGNGLMDIYVHPQIDSPEYRNVLVTLQRLDNEKRPSVLALDLQKVMYKESISRNEWMAKTVAAGIARNPDTKMLVVVGNFHVFIKIIWQDHVQNKVGSIREYLNRIMPDLKPYSIGQLIDGLIVY